MEPLEHLRGLPGHRHGLVLYRDTIIRYRDKTWMHSSINSKPFFARLTLSW
jgi:hypothetical protein